MEEPPQQDLQLSSLPDSVSKILNDLAENGVKSTTAKGLLLGFVLGGIGRASHRVMQEGPRVYCQRNEWTEAVMAMLSRDEASALRRFFPGLPSVSGHMSTLLGFIRFHPQTLPSSRELITTPDDGHFALDWYQENVSGGQDLRRKPIVLILHGVNGHGDESYMRHLAHLISKRGWRAVNMTFRGCGDLTLSSAIAYNASFTQDIDQAVTTISGRFPDSPLFLVGFSLGANLMVKYLGEKEGGARVAGAVAISNPWCFLPHVETLHNPRNPRWNLAARVYSFLLGYEYKRYVRRHRDQLSVAEDVQQKINQCHTLRALDEHVTVPVWGYRDLEHYLTESSCSEYLDRVQVPLLGINALDDPFVSREAIDYTLRKANANPRVVLVTTRRGGHIGWGEGLAHLWQGSWAERLCVDYIEALLKLRERGVSPSFTPRARL